MAGDGIREFRLLPVDLYAVSFEEVHGWKQRKVTQDHLAPALSLWERSS